MFQDSQRVPISIKPSMESGVIDSATIHNVEKDSSADVKKINLYFSKIINKYSLRNKCASAREVCGKMEAVLISEAKAQSRTEEMGKGEKRRK